MAVVVAGWRNGGVDVVGGGVGVSSCLSVVRLAAGRYVEEASSARNEGHTERAREKQQTTTLGTGGSRGVKEGGRPHRLEKAAVIDGQKNSNGICQHAQSWKADGHSDRPIWRMCPTSFPVMGRITLQRRCGGGGALPRLNAEQPSKSCFAVLVHHGDVVFS